METTATATGEHPNVPTTRSRWWWASRIALGLVSLGALYVGGTFVQVWRASTHDSARPSEAIVVLGAAQYDGRPSPVFQTRLDRAFELYSAGVAPLVVTTGGNQVGDRFTEGFAGYDYLRGRGVPDEDLLVVTDGVNTWEELSATAHQLDLRDLDRVVLVSDGYHALRLEHIADDVGLDATVASTDGSATLRQLARETAAVSIGRVIGYRRLADLS